MDSVKALTSSQQTNTLHAVPVDETQPVFTINEVPESKVLEILSSLKSSKAKDSYGIDSNFLRKHQESLSEPITKMVNASVREAVFPQAWKSAIVTPIFKSGSVNDVSNYRPISILPIVSKVPEKALQTKYVHTLIAARIHFTPCSLGSEPTIPPKRLTASS